MRKGWEYKKLGEVCDVYQPKTLSTDMLSKDGEYPVYGANGIIGYYHQYNHEDKEVLLTCRGATCGNINVSKPYSWINGNAMVIHRKSEFIDFDFLKYMMLSLDYSLIITGAAQPQITRQKLAPIKIAIPPKSIQLAIVSELDKINELIRLKKEQLKDFDNLAQSLFYEMFGDPVENEKGWEVKKLGEIGEFKNGLNFSKDENGHSIKFLGVSDFQNKKSIASDQLAYISLSERVQEDYLLKTGDIVFVRSNGKKELIGRSVKMYITEPTTYSGFCIRCRITDEKVDKDYIAILLKTPIIRQFMTNSGRGCNISNLNQKVLNSIPTILPPLSLQRLFAQRIEQIEREKSEVQKSIQDLETLLASRMQYWFE